jgi:ubiquinone/menaquinone biosynthesis C-methylase UbiE
MMPDSPWNHSIQYHHLVLSAVPQGCQRALDVGCGQGLLARQLTARCQEVIAIDRDHEVLSRARACCLEPRVTLVEGDVMTHPFAVDSFDLITAVATLHHLPLRPALTRFRNLLRSGGILAIIGLYRAQTLGDYALAASAFPSSWILRVLRGHTDVGSPVQNPRETLYQIRSACDALLPGTVLRRHLLFRYSLVWRKP